MSQPCIDCENKSDSGDPSVRRCDECAHTCWECGEVREHVYEDDDQVTCERCMYLLKGTDIGAALS